MCASVCVCTHVRMHLIQGHCLETEKNLYWKKNNYKRISAYFHQTIRGAFWIRTDTSRGIFSAISN